MNAEASTLAVPLEARTARTGYWWLLAAAGWWLASLFDANAGELKRELFQAGALSEGQFTTIFGITLAITWLGSIALGYLADRVAQRRLLAVALLMLCVANALYPLELYGLMLLAEVLNQLASILLLQLLIIFVADNGFVQRGAAAALVPGMSLLTGLGLTGLYQISPTLHELGFTFAITAGSALALAAGSVYWSVRVAPQAPAMAEPSSRTYWGALVNLLVATALVGMLLRTLLFYGQSLLYSPGIVPANVVQQRLEALVAEIALLAVAGTLLGAWIAARWPRWLAAYIGLAVAMAIAGALLGPGMGEEDPMVVAFGLGHCGSSLATAMLYVAIMQWCRHERRGIAVGVVMTVQAVLGSVGTAIFTMLGFMGQSQLLTTVLVIGAVVAAMALLHIWLAHRFATQPWEPKQAGADGASPAA